MPSHAKRKLEKGRVFACAGAGSSPSREKTLTSRTRRVLRQGASEARRSRPPPRHREDDPRARQPQPHHRPRRGAGGRRSRLRRAVRGPQGTRRARGGARRREAVQRRPRSDHAHAVSIVARRSICERHARRVDAFERPRGRPPAGQRARDSNLRPCTHAREKSDVQPRNLLPLRRTPYVTGTTVLGCKYKDGVMIACDTLGASRTPEPARDPTLPARARELRSRFSRRARTVTLNPAPAEARPHTRSNCLV